MNFKPKPKLLDWYFQGEVDNWVFEIKPDSKARLTEKFTEDSIPENIHEDLIWIWGYMKSKYPISHDDEKEREKRELKSDRVAEIYRDFRAGKGLSALFHQDEIESITINYKVEKGKLLREKRVLDTYDFIRFMCEAVGNYEVVTKDTVGYHLKAQSYKALEIEYNKEKVLNSGESGFKEKRDDARKIYWFLKEHSSDLSDRAIFRFGAWLMFDAGVKFKDCYEKTGEWKESFESDACGTNFRDWARMKGRDADKINPFLRVKEAMEELERRFPNHLKY